MYEGYCVKCKAKKFYHGVVELTGSGRNIAKGPCPTCKTTVCRMLGSKPKAA